MPPANQSGSQNQTLLELIYAMKSLAQQVELYHQDLSRRLDEEVKSRQRDLLRILDLTGKNSQSLSVLPITMSDRVEKLLGRLESEVDDKFDTVTRAIEDVRRTLQEHTRTTDRAISQNEMNAIAEAKSEGQDITGRIELTEDGGVQVKLNSKLLKKIWIGVMVIATGGGAYSFGKMIMALFGG